VRTTGAERDPHAELAPPLRHRVGQHAIQPDRREDERQPGEAADDARREAGPGHRCRERDGERLDAVDNREWLDFSNDLPNSRHKRRGIVIRAQHQLDVTANGAFGRVVEDIDLGLGGFSVAGLEHVA
jgi:hypothetical protein